MKEKIRTAYDLINLYYRKNPSGHFFDADTLRFFGETRSSMRLLKTTETRMDALGRPHVCYVLSRLQKKHPDGPRRTRAYFDTETLTDI